MMRSLCKSHLKTRYQYTNRIVCYIAGRVSRSWLILRICVIHTCEAYEIPRVSKFMTGEWLFINVTAFQWVYSILLPIQNADSPSDPKLSDKPQIWILISLPCLNRQINRTKVIFSWKLRNRIYVDTSYVPLLVTIEILHTKFKNTETPLFEKILSQTKAQRGWKSP